MSKEIKLIAIEGSDGSGKATQTEMLATYLEETGLRMGRISFPRYMETFGGRMLFEFLKSPRALEYDFANANPKLASRIYAQDRFESLGYLKTLIAENDVVIFDRYVDSNLLHQGGKMKSSAEILDFADWLYDLEYRELGLPKPDVTIYLDLPPEVSFARALKRAKEKGESLDAVESDMEYVKNGAKAGRLCAKHFGWNVIECVVPNQDKSLPPYECSPLEINHEILEILGKI
ncbi:MAG: hypothetical protein WAZ40_00775 [Minisyncoccia bacterium]